MCDEERGPVEVERGVFECIEAIRTSGLTNMLDRDRVAELATELGFHAGAHWVRENRDLYARAIFQGFEVTK